MKKKSVGIRVITVALIGAFSQSCGSGISTGASDSNTTYTYSGPGSHYTVTMNSSSFTIKKFETSTSTNPDFTVSGSVATTYGFKKLSVSTVTGTGGPSVGSTAYGLEVPGLALFIQPVDTGNPDQVIAAVSSGKCPTSTLDANWIIVKQSGTANVASTSTDTFGTFTYSPVTGIASVSTKYSLAALTTNLGSNAFTSATCKDGIMSVASGNSTAVMYLTSGGGAIVNTASTNSSDASYIFGLPIAAVTVSKFTGTYSGFMYSGAQASGSRFKAIKATLTGSGTSISGTGTSLKDASTDTADTGSATLSLTSVDTPKPGFMTGTLTTGSGTQNVSCMLLADAVGSGKQIINCAGIDPGSTSKLFNFMLVSR